MIHLESRCQKCLLSNLNVCCNLLFPFVCFTKIPLDAMLCIPIDLSSHECDDDDTSKLGNLGLFLYVEIDSGFSRLIDYTELNALITNASS